MTGPRDEDLDRAVEDDMLHEFAFGFPLLWRPELEPRRDELDAEEDDDAAEAS